MNTMDLLSTLWIISNLKTKSYKHNHNNYKINYISLMDGKMTEGMKGIINHQDLTQNQDHQIKTTAIMTSTPPHSNRKKKKITS